MPKRTVKTAFAHYTKRAGCTQAAGRAMEVWKADPRWSRRHTNVDEAGVPVPSEEEIALGMRIIREAVEAVRWIGSPLLKPECEGDAEDNE